MSLFSKDRDVHSYQMADRTIACPQCGGTDSVNRRQLESGLAAFRDFGPYAVDGYLRCDLVRAQEIARRATRGLWAAQ